MLKITKSATLLLASGVISLVLPALAHAEVFGDTLTENADGTLTSSLAGTVVSGTTDDWTIDFSALVAGSGFSFEGGGTNMTWVQPDGGAGVSYLTEASSDTLDLFGHDTSAPTGLDCGGSTSPLADGVSCLVGQDNAGNTYYVSVAGPAASATPEPASLIMSGLGLLGLGAFSIRRKRQA